MREDERKALYTRHFTFQTCRAFPLTSTGPDAVYEFLYTSIGQAIAAYAPNEYFAAIMNPLLIGAGLVSFCGVVVPYEAIQPFWRYWIYWLDPFHYLFGGLLTPVIWDVAVECAAAELVSFDAPGNQTCGEYMSGFLAENPGYLVDPAATSGCEYCAYSRGSEYVRTFSINARYYGWRDVSSPRLRVCAQNLLECAC